jgi:predicted PurR-regulated permease PerM
MGVMTWHPRWRAAGPPDPAEPDGGTEQGCPARLASAAQADEDARDGALEGHGDPAGPASRLARLVPAESQGVPGLLQRAAAWSWRILLVGLLIYLAYRVATTLRVVVLPCIAALLLTALLQPVTSRLKRTGMPALAATWCTILAVAVIIGGIAIIAANRASADYPTLASEVRHTARELQVALSGPPFHLSSQRLEQISGELVSFLSQHRSLVAGTVLTGGKIVLEVLTGLVLMLFVTFFLLKDGDRIWAWLISGMGTDRRRRAELAGDAAWLALTNYMRGTLAVAIIHAVLIGLALWIIGVPLLVPLVILVFLAAFVPLVGILIAGALAIAVTLGTKGWIAALILLAVFLAENQIESHLLQPLVVGRIVRLHPLAIILVLAVGGVVAGIAGAIVAVPAAAAISYAWPHLRLRPRPPGEADRRIGSPP